MGKDTFLIELDNNSDVYYPGQTITGKVELELFGKLKLTAITITFKGYAEVHWTEQQGSGDYQYTVHYTNYEEYFNTKVGLFGKAQTGKDKSKLEPGKYSYPFSFQLPMGIPSSYEAIIGRVRYCLQADINIPWGFDKHTKRIFTVVNLLDLNTIQNAMGGASKDGQKTLCCLCCESDPISATVMVDRIGYVPGEAITFRAEINNRSNREMSSSKAQLIMQVDYHATEKTQTVKNKVNQLKHGKIDAGGTDVWMNETLHVPPLPPSYLQGCRIIDIRYYLNICVVPRGPALNLDVPVEVVIGSIPLVSVAQQFGVTLPSALPAPSPGLRPPQGLYSEALLPTNIPQASLAESAMGRMGPREEGDTEHTTVNADYAPVYTYYNLNKPDITTTFSVQTNEK